MTPPKKDLKAKAEDSPGRDAPCISRGGAARTPLPAPRRTSSHGVRVKEPQEQLHERRRGCSQGRPRSNTSPTSRPACATPSRVPGGHGAGLPVRRSRPRRRRRWPAGRRPRGQAPGHAQAGRRAARLRLASPPARTVAWILRRRAFRRSRCASRSSAGGARPCPRATEVRARSVSLTSAVADQRARCDVA